MGRRSASEGTRQRLVDLGSLPPIVIDANWQGLLRPSDTMRWRIGFLALSITSTALAAGALWATLYQAQPIVLDKVPTQIAAHKSNLTASKIKGDITTQVPSEEAIYEAHETTIAVAVVTRDKEKQIVETQPYRFVSQPLVQSRSALGDNIPPYNIAKTIRSLPDSTEGPDKIYSGEVNADFSVEIIPFPSKVEWMNDSYNALNGDTSHVFLTSSQTHLEANSFSKSSLSEEFEGIIDNISGNLNLPPNVTVLDANITSLVKSVDEATLQATNTLVDLIQPSDTIQDVLLSSGVTAFEADRSRGIVSSALNGGTLKEGDIVEINFRPAKPGATRRQIERFTAYRDGSPLLSFARTDAGDLTVAQPHRMTPPSIAETMLPDPGGRGHPTIYEGLYQAALAKDVPKRLIGELVRAFAFEVDLSRPVSAGDRIEAIFSQNGKAGRSATTGPKDEILFAALTLNGVEYRAYRFQDPISRKVMLYDERGRSVSRLLLHKPMVGGSFRSGFGMRRHPILKTSKMHTGVDWAASRGTPIYAAGNAVVSRAGWQGGYGRAVRLRLENGYEALYAHMSKIADGVKAGKMVRQGDVIGYVGTSGLSTGNHLHYELSVNGRRVDPLRQRVPHERELSGDALRAFEEERNRIDTLDETAHGDAHRSLT